MHPSLIEAAIPIAAGMLSTLIGYRSAMSGDAQGTGLANKTLRIVGPLLIAFGLLLLLIGRGDTPPMAGALVTDIKSKLSLPMQIDEDTRLDDIRAPSDGEIEYLMTITTRTNAELKDQRFAEVLEFSISAGSCENPDHLKLLQAGYKLILSYRSSDDHEVASIEIAPSDCPSR